MQRRKLVGLLGAQAMCSVAAPALAYKSKDPCKGKGKAAPDSLGIWPTSISHGRGVAGLYRHHGDTAAAVHRDFQATIESNFLAMPSASINPLLSRMHPRELESLCQLYDAASLNSGQPAKFLDIVSAKLDRKQIQRLVRVQGFERVYASILREAPSNAQFVIDALHAPGKARPMQPGATTGFDENPLDYTIKEVYLSYRTAPRGSYSVPAAMYETASFVGLRLSASFTAGYAVGTAIQKTWQTLSPNTWDKFSDYIGSSIDGFVRSASSVMGITPYASMSEAMHAQIGALQENLWNDFQDAGPRSWYAGGGDFGVTVSWQIKERRGDCR